MKRLHVAGSLAAALLIGLPPLAMARHTGERHCADPSEAETFACAMVIVIVAEDADIHDVVRRSVPEAEVTDNHGEQAAAHDADIPSDDPRWNYWTLAVADGREIPVRDRLLLDHDVVNAGLVYIGDESAGALPDGAVPIAVGTSRVRAMVLGIGTVLLVSTAGLVGARWVSRRRAVRDR
jgi:hypothetical protein